MDLNLDRNQALLEFALTRSSTIFYAADPARENALSFVSPNVETLTGHKPNTLLKDPGSWMDLVHPDDRHRLAIGAVQDVGKPLEYRVATRSGDYRWFRDEGQLIRDNGGTPKRIGCLVDVTAERDALARLAEAEAREAAKIAAEQNAVIAIDSTGSIIEYAGSAEEMFGYDREQILGRSFSEVIVPERHRRGHVDAISRLAETGELGALGDRRRIDALRSDGREIPVEITFAPAPRGDEFIYVAEISDLSEKVASERERHRLSRLLEDAVESLPGGFALYDSDDRIVVANSALKHIYGLESETLTGLAREQVLGLTVPRMKTFDGTPVSNDLATIARLAEMSRRLVDRTVEIELKNGSWRLLCGRPTTDGGQVLVSLDITDRKRIEAELRESEELVRRVLEAAPVPVRMTRLKDGHILYESPASREAYGAPEGMEPEDVHKHYVVPSDRTRYVAALKEAGTIDGYELQLRRHDGEIYPGLVSAKLIEYRGVQVIVSSTLDLTQRKAREAKLRETRETLEDAIESLREGFALYDQDDRLIICNERYREFHATGADMLRPGVSWIDLMRTEARRGLYVDAVGREEQWVRDRIAARRELRTDLEYQQSDGRWLVGSNRRTRQGGTVVTLSEITGRKRREELIREAREVLEDAVESLSEGFALWDADDRLVMCNQQYKKLNAVCDDILVPGITWEALLRTGAERGQFANAAGRVDAFMVECRRARQGLDRGFEFEQTDGRWYVGLSRKTRDGGTVGMRIDITERKQMEQAVRRSEVLVRRVLEACPMPVIVNRTDDGEILYESPAAKSLYTGDTASTQHSVLDRWARLSDRNDYIAHLKTQGSIDGWEVEKRKHDGTHFWALQSARLIQYQGEEVVVSSVLDLTEQKAREAELRAARETLEDAIEALSDGFSLYDADDRLILCNSKFREFNPTIRDVIVPGVDWAELLRLAVERGQYPQVRGRFEEWLAYWQEARRTHRKDIIHRQSDGRWYAFSAHSTRGGGIVFLKRDVTEQKEFETALRDSEEMVRKVLEACPVPITMNCLDSGEIIFESPAAKSLYYRSSDPADGGVTTLQQWMRLSDRDAYVQQLRETGSVDGLEVEFRRADGERFWALESARLIDYQGEDVVVSNALDLTDRKANEAEIARQREALHQSEKLGALGELLAGVSHELNNPLSVLVGQALLLKETTTDPDIVHRAEKIGEAADRCARIVKSFLAMARQEATGSRAADVNEIVEQALEVTAYALRAADIELVLDLDPQLPPVMLDGDQFGQVVTNLVVNAQHALDEADGPRRLTIETRHLAGANLAQLTISDNGPGIPDHIRSRIFEPLFTTKEVGSGTGIGLALCHRVVETHGGKIEVDSQPGEGARFIITLPCTQAAHAEETKPHDGGRDDAAGRVLVVDDEPEVAAVLAEILRNDGHPTRIAHTGEDALKLIASEPFDVILSDIRMPQLDGPSLYRMLRRERPELIAKMAFITGDTLGQKARDFLRSVDRPFLEKPITPEDVRELMKEICGDGR